MIVLSIYSCLGFRYHNFAFDMLEGRYAVVTGAGRGIGRQISLSLAGAGSRVALLDVDEGALSGTANRVQGCGVPVLIYKVDVSVYQQVKEVFEEIHRAWGRIDILVNNAGILRDNLIPRLGQEDWDRVLDVNLKGVFNCIKAVSRYMLRERYGRIINISSVSGIKGNPGQASYSASKAGVIALTKTAAKEFASRGITVNAIAPGFIMTEMLSGMDEKVRERITASIPLGRLGEPKDVANLVLFLSSEDAGYITGETIVIDGGVSL